MIERLSPQQATACVDQLSALLQDAVAAGASIGFLPPLAAHDARVYWDAVIAAMRSGSRLLLIARDAGRIVGTVQLDLAGMPNGSHRAEVMKLMVESQSRRRGFGRVLMQAIEDAARQAGRSLLVLDTRVGDFTTQ